MGETPQRPEMNAFSELAPAGVAVTVSARLHLGFIDLNGSLGRRFGSVGLAISAPRGMVTLRRAAATRIEGVDSERAGRYLAAMQQHLGLAGGHHLAVVNALPQHAGLGSGTQLALAVAAALRRLYGLALDAPGDALQLDRGARSGVGVGLFEAGGLVVDAGRGPNTAMPPIISRMDFPPEWRIIIVLDPTHQGLFGESERAAFKALGPMAASDAAHACRLLLMQALPALAERDIMRFVAAIGQMQETLGDYFAPAQAGHRFTSCKVAAVLNLLANEGAHGVGQSSWGPTGFAFAEGAEEAERLADLARRRPESSALDIRVVSGLNRGAEATTIAASRVQTI
jgi:beta-RFAP synthase